MSGKWSATWHPRPCPPWQCQFCGQSFGTDSVNQRHEPKCPLRPQENR